MILIVWFIITILDLVIFFLNEHQFKLMRKKYDELNNRVDDYINNRKDENVL